MNINVLLLALTAVINSSTQIVEFEKEALSSVQRISASRFDEQLPRRPFGVWFSELAGEQAGVVWQLSECGDPAKAKEKPGQIPACAEVNAVLPNGSKVVVMIRVGTFQGGLKGEPTFLGAVIEYNDRFYQVNHLRDLPKRVRNPGNGPIDLPGVTAKQALLKLHFHPPPTSGTKILENDDGDGQATDQPAPPPPPRKVSEGVVQGWAVTRVKPDYPANARRMNAYGPVEVRIIISPEGNVLEAAAISGHLALRKAAVAAARGWTFKPTTVDGVPVNTESILTFVFAPGSNR
jgi:TonB family protein